MVDDAWWTAFVTRAHGIKAEIPDSEVLEFEVGN